MSELAQQQEEIIVEQSAPVPSPDPEIEVTEQDEKQEAQTAPKQETKAFDPKTDKVEFTTPEQQQKFDYIYKQTKMSDQRNQMLTDMLQQATKRIEEVESRFKQTDSAEAERILISKIKGARDIGDDASEFAATRELAEFIADKKISEKINYQPQYQAPPVNPADIKYTEEFMYAADESGNLVRPWIQDGHPGQAEAIQFIEQAKQKYLGDPYALPKTLAELDNYMRGKPQLTQQKTPPSSPNTRAPSPMAGGNLTNNTGKTTIKMTRQELEIAKKLGVDPKRYAARRDEIKGRK